MLQELLSRLPPIVAEGPRATAISVGVAVAGLILWLLGARIGRSMFTLIGVAAGAWLGLHAPKWLGWEIDSMGPAIGGALAFGLAGYLLQTIWVGLTLATLLSAAGAFIAWHRLGGIEIAAPDFTKPWSELSQFAWDSLPHGILYAAAGCFAAGLLISTFWQKLAKVFAFSMLGTLILVLGGLIAIQISRPQWLERIPPSIQTRGVAIAIFIAVGAAIQWILYPGVAKVKEEEKAETTAPPAPAPSAPQARAAFRPRNVSEVVLTPLGPLKMKEARA